MTPEERDYFEEFLLKAVQSGKAETSGLVDTIMHKVEKELEPVIDKLVNGKINKLLVMQEGQNKILTEIQEQIKTIKTDTTPLIDDRKVITGLGRFVLWIGGIVITIAGVLKLVK